MRCWGELKRFRAQSVGEIIDFLKVLRFSFPVCAREKFWPWLVASLQSRTQSPELFCACRGERSRITRAFRLRTHSQARKHWGREWASLVRSVGQCKCWSVQGQGVPAMRAISRIYGNEGQPGLQLLKKLATTPVALIATKGRCFTLCTD